jgi:DNA polymerase III alpha subunit
MSAQRCWMPASHDPPSRCRFSRRRDWTRSRRADVRRANHCPHPLTRRHADEAIITQLDYPTCETLGLLKTDSLDLRNPTIIDDAAKNIELNRHTTLDRTQIPLDDEHTYQLLAAETIDVFQLDGRGTRELRRAT